MFIVIAAGLIGLLVLGAIAVGGILIIPQIFRPAATPTVRIAVAPTATRALPTATLPPPTDTPAPTATLVVSGGLTPVVSAATATVTATVAVTGTVTGTPTGQLPKSGLGEDLLLLAAGVVLVLVIFAARRVRSAGTA
jgi:hypothetical protein